MNHEEFIDRTFELAVQGRGFVSPNPMVGCVIVKDGRKLAEGWHKKFGADHAEVDAINNAVENVCGATLYVNLLPCCHHGKTPPCTDAIINSGIKRVVYSNHDPNPKVRDETVGILESAGIEVVGGIFEGRGKQLNKKYFTWIETGKPYVTAKMAMTLDGKVATKDYESKWITGPECRAFVHELRKNYDAILVGANTVLSDDPELSLHGLEGNEPFRIILTSDPAQFDDLRELRVFRDDRFGFLDSIASLNSFCSDKGISSVFVEGGTKTFTSFLKSGVVDDVFLFYAAKFLGNEHISVVDDLGLPRLDDSIDYKLATVSQFGNDFMVKLDKFSPAL